MTMGSAQQWEPESEAAELLAIKHRTLRSMRRDDRLSPGDQIIFATATTGGPDVYNVNPIRRSVAQRCKKMVAANLQRREQQKQALKAAIKIYGEEGMDRSSMQVTA